MPVKRLRASSHNRPFTDATAAGNTTGGENTTNVPPISVMWRTISEAIGSTSKTLRLIMIIAALAAAVIVLSRFAASSGHLAVIDHLLKQASITTDDRARRLQPSGTPLSSPRKASG